MKLKMIDGRDCCLPWAQLPVKSLATSQGELQNLSIWYCLPVV